jgi:hypothetical protein
MLHEVCHGNGIVEVMLEMTTLGVETWLPLGCLRGFQPHMDKHSVPNVGSDVTANKRGIGLLERLIVQGYPFSHTGAVQPRETKSVSRRRVQPCVGV